MLLQWLPDIQSRELQVWLADQLTGLCSHGHRSRMSCCTSGMISHIITVLGRQKQIDHKAVGEFVICWVQYCLWCSTDQPQSCWLVCVCWVLITHIITILGCQKEIDHKAVGECVICWVQGCLWCSTDQPQGCGWLCACWVQGFYATDWLQGYHKTTDMVTHIITILGRQKQIDHKTVGECALLGSVLSMQQISHKAVRECALSWVQFCLSCSADRPQGCRWELGSVLFLQQINHQTHYFVCMYVWFPFCS